MLWFLRKPSGKQVRNVSTSEATCDEIDFRNFCGGMVTVSAGITLLTLYTAHETGDTFLPYYDRNDDPVTLIVSSAKATQLPLEIYDIPFAKFVANTSGTISVSTKS